MLKDTKNAKHVKTLNGQINLDMNNLVQMEDVNKRIEPTKELPDNLKKPIPLDVPKESVKEQKRSQDVMTFKEQTGTGGTNSILQDDNEMPFQVMAVDDPASLKKYKDNSEDKISIAESEINNLFYELDKLNIQSEVSIAYSELIRSLKSKSVDKGEIKEVIQGYGINPFEYTQIN